MGARAGKPLPRPRILLIDNFDSFTYNVLHGLVEAGGDVEVRRADLLDLETIKPYRPDMIVISPGPGRPEDAALSLAVLHRFGGRIPILGICLGMQAMAVAFGGQVAPSPAPVHGKVSDVLHDGRGLFEGLPSPMPVGRYHSLCVTEVPAAFEITARTVEGLVMGLRHREQIMAGVQFHPDSFLTPHGREMMRHAIHGRF
jgi:anthranilate synthase/aminodeoxychorismate synthase-like glutamine amidotransferase